MSGVRLVGLNTYPDRAHVFEPKEFLSEFCGVERIINVVDEFFWIPREHEALAYDLFRKGSKSLVQ